MEGIKQILDGVDAVSVANIFGNISDSFLNEGFMLTPKNRLPVNPTEYYTSPITYNAILLKKGSSFSISTGESTHRVIVTDDITINPKEMLDKNIGKSYDLTDLAHGQDYFIYAHIQEGTNEVDLIVSANSTYPESLDSYSPYTENNTRKIGGFHYGTVRLVDSDGNPMDGAGNTFGTTSPKWEQNVVLSMVVPNSVWDLSDTKFGRNPHFGGTVMVGGQWNASGEGTGHYTRKGGRFWHTIYALSRVTGEDRIYPEATPGVLVRSGTFASRYGTQAITGPIYPTGINYLDLSFATNGALPSMEETLRAAYGQPQGEDNDNNYGYTATTNRTYTFTGCAVDTSTGEFNSSTGVKKYAVSAWNICDLAGNWTKLTRDFSAGTFGDKAGTINNDNYDMFPSAKVGKVEVLPGYTPSQLTLAIMNLVFSGRFSHGSVNGQRAMNACTGVQSKKTMSTIFLVFDA